MHLAPAGQALIKSFEGCQLTAYNLGDGMITIGWGHAEPVGNTSLVAGQTRWSQAQADSVFLSDMVRYENIVTSWAGNQLNQNQFDALTSLAYNAGNVFVSDNWGAFSVPTVQRMLPLYINKGTQFEAGLTRRRQAELALFNKPVDGSETPAQKKKKGNKQMHVLVQLVDKKDVYEVINGLYTRVQNPAVLTNMKAVQPDLVTYPMTYKEMTEQYKPLKEK